MMSPAPPEGDPPSSPRVLVVDDDTSTVMSLVDALDGEGYEVLTAADGREALEVLKRHDVSLVLTDVKMPRMDGISLLVEMMRMNSLISCVVMTAYGTPEMESRLESIGAVHFMNKPIEISALREVIRKELEQRSGNGRLRGVSLPGVIQLLALERHTCTIKVHGEGRSGLLFMRSGTLFDASTDDLQGEPAALEILSWDGAEILMRKGCRKRKCVLDRGLEALLMESARIRDEGRRDQEGDPPRQHDPGGAKRQEDGKEKWQMALESYLQQFKEIKGYLASGIMDFTGESLAAHTASESIDLQAVGVVFNDIFRSAHEASGKIGLEACRRMTIQTPKGLIIMECSGVNASAHVHFIVVMEEGGNQALAKMTLDKTVPKVVQEMS